MKKLLMLVLAAMILSSHVACTKNALLPTSPSESTNTNPPTP